MGQGDRRNERRVVGSAPDTSAAWRGCGNWCAARRFTASWLSNINRSGSFCGAFGEGRASTGRAARHLYVLADVPTSGKDRS